MLNKEFKPPVVETADDVVTDYAVRQSTLVYKRIREIMDGKVPANKDTKRNLCRDMNLWIDFFMANNERASEFYHYRLGKDGEIEMYHPGID